MNRPRSLFPKQAASRLMQASLLTAALALAGCDGRGAAELARAGDAHMAKRDYNAAIIQFKNALHAKPESSELRLKLGLALLEAGDPVSAVVELEKAAELNARDESVIPPLARALVAIGEHHKLLAKFGETLLANPEAQADLLTSLATAHLWRNDAASSAELAAAALQSVPGYARAVVLQARLRAAEGNLDESLALLNGVLSREADHELAGLLKGEVLWFGKRDRDAALATFKGVLLKHPSSVPAHTSAITILHEQQQLDAARAQFAELKKVAPGHPDSVFFEAQFAFIDGDFKKSRELTDLLLKAAPNNPRVLEVAGAAELQIGRPVVAEAFLANAVKHAPHRLLSRQMLAQAQLRLNQPAKAISALTPVIEGKSPDGISLALAGEAYLQLGQNKLADQAFAAAAKAAPDDKQVRTRVAVADLVRGHSGPAIAKLEAVAAEDTGVRADIVLLSERLRAKDLGGALKAIEAIERKQPDKALAHQLRGRVQLLQRDMPGATKSFETALAKERGYFPAIMSLAAIDLDAGRADAARKRLEDHIKANPKSTQAHLSLAEWAERTGAEPAVVQKHLRDAAKTDTGDVRPHLLLVNHLLSTGHTAAALDAAREGAAALPTHPTMLETLGQTQLATHDAASAVATFKGLTSLVGTNALYHVRLAEALLASNDLAAARRSLDQALKLRPGLEAARVTMVRLLLREQQPDQAIAVAREMQRAEPRSSAGWLLEGDIEAARRNTDRATAAFRRAIELDKATHTAVRLHMALQGSGRQSEADKLVSDWSRDNPRDVAFMYYQGDLASGRGEWAAAEKFYRAVLAAQPRNALAMNSVADLLMKQGKPGALPITKKANELMPGRPQLMDTMAQALAADRKLPEAVELQKAAVARAPTDPSLRLTLARLLIQSGDKTVARAELEALAKLGDRFRDQTEVRKLLATL